MIESEDVEVSKNDPISTSQSFGLFYALAVDHDSCSWTWHQSHDIISILKRAVLVENTGPIQPNLGDVLSNNVNISHCRRSRLEVVHQAFR